MTCASCTTTPATPDALQQDLLRMLAEGRGLEAFHRYYDENVRMQENEGEPCVGFAANLIREQAFFDSVASFQEFTILARGSGGDHTFYECVMRWTDLGGTAHRLRQVVVARWRDGRIVEERFVYGGQA